MLLDVRWELGGPPGARRLPTRAHPGRRVRRPRRGAGRAAGARWAPPAARRPRSSPRRCARPGVSGDARPWSSTTPATRSRRRGRGGCCATSATVHVAVLDGGFAAWVAAGLAVATERSAPRPRAGDFSRRARRHAVARRRRARPALARSGVLIDARTAERFRGEQRAGRSGGAATSRARVNRRHRGQRRRRWAVPGHRRAAASAFAAVGVRRRTCRSAPTAVRACRRRTKCWRSSSPATGPRCTRARGASGSLTRTGLWLAVLSDHHAVARGLRDPAELDLVELGIERAAARSARARGAARSASPSARSSRPGSGGCRRRTGSTYRCRAGLGRGTARGGTRRRSG